MPTSKDVTQPNKCAQCVHFSSYQDGEMETQFGESICTSLSWEYE